MASFTSRLNLRKPATGELVDVDTDLNANFDKIDLYTGTFACTSNSRPTAPWTGLLIFETDTKRIFVWDGAGWDYVGGEPRKTVRGSGGSLTTDWASPTNNAQLDNVKPGVYEYFGRVAIELSQANGVNKTYSSLMFIGATPQNEHRQDYQYINGTGAVQTTTIYYTFSGEITLTAENYVSIRNKVSATGGSQFPAYCWLSLVRVAG